jgi:type II secretory pathway pseudopilin PulG
LIELAVVLAALALIAGTMLSVATVKIERRQAVAMADTLDVLDEALLHYYRQFGHFPCPASMTEPENTATFGRATDCAAAAPAGTADSGAATDAVRTGLIPIRTLVIADSAMFDPWGDRIQYTVIKDLAKDQATFDAYTTALTTGVIQIVDLNDNQVTNDDGKTIVAYALVSHGKDAKGAANRLGTVVYACTNATKDGENCNNDAVIRDTDLQDSTIAANYYDDFVRWRTLGDLPAVSGATSNSCTFPLQVGYSNVCISKSDKTLWCWGVQSDGELGHGVATGTYTTPIQATNVTNCIQGTFSDGVGCVKHADGTAWCWGANASGQTGDGTTVSPRLAPVQVSGLNGLNLG